MKKTSPFEYHKLEQITYENGTRKYITPEGDHVPSVTTILSATGDKSGLRAWAEWVGEKEADKQRKEAASLGTLLHTHLESHIDGLERPKGSNLIRKMAKDMADVLIERGLSRVSEIWGIEKAQYFPELYAGTADLIGLFEGAPAIMDYKTSKKIKKEEYILDYKCQLAAYSLAHNEVYNTNIKTAAIFMIARDLSYKTFVIEGLAFQKACDAWLFRLDEWFSKDSN